jgi:hypothetical protein
VLEAAQLAWFDLALAARADRADRADQVVRVADRA